jgi:hypothetical protein
MSSSPQPINPNLESLQFDKRTLRLIKNREAADLSRKKKKLEFTKLQQRVEELEKRVEELETENELAWKRIKELEDNQVVDVGLQQSDMGLFFEEPAISNPIPFTSIHQNSLFSGLQSDQFLPKEDLQNAMQILPSSPNSSSESTLFSDTPSPSSDDLFHYVNLDFSETSSLGFFAVYFSKLDFSSFIYYIFDSVIQDFCSKCDCTNFFNLSFSSANVWVSTDQTNQCTSISFAPNFGGCKDTGL